MKSFFKKWDYLIITIVCALIIVISIYMLQDVSPFGNHSLLTIDFFHQYGPMLSELYNRIWKGKNLIYSFSMGMGLPFFRNFFNYLSSPFNVIILLFSHRDLLMSYSFVIGLKVITSAGTMVYYLNHKFKKNYLFVALSILYAFCAYFTAYYWNIMWLDGLVMLPLIAYGIELLVNKNEILLYVISLAIMLFANYFIGFMLCIFSVLYFILYMFISTNTISIKRLLKKCIYFAISSLIAGGICACFLIPMYFALKGISATHDIWPNSQYYDFSLIEFIFNHFSGVGSTVLKSGITTAPNVSVGILPIALILLFIINHNINFKIKIGYVIFLIILFFSYKIASIDFIWHAFHVPNDLPYRYSFIYSFIIIVMSAYSINYIKNIKKGSVGIIYVLMLVLITLMKYSTYKNISDDMILMNYIIITICYLSYIIFIYFKKFSKYSLLFITLTACLECVLVVNNNWNIDQDLNGFYSDFEDISDGLNYIKSMDNDMFRIEKNSILTFNDPSWYDYYGQVAFSSMEYENLAILQHNLGMPSNEINSFYYKQNTPIYNLMFNMKYLIGNTVDKDKYSLYYSNDTQDFYKNNFNVGLMFGVSSNIKKWENNFENPFLNQNDFINKATNITNTLEEINFKSNVVYNSDKKIVKYTFINNFDNYYLYYNNPNVDFLVIDGTMYYNNTNYKYVDNCKEIMVNEYIDYNEEFIIDKINRNDKVIDFYVGYNNYYFDNVYLYRINQGNFQKVYSSLINDKLDIIEFKEHYIKAISNNEKSITIYTSIPYDIGWNVYVDGKRQNTYEIANTLLSFDLPSGEHEIVLKYHIPYIKIGLIISILSLGSLFILLKYKKEN